MKKLLLMVTAALVSLTSFAFTPVPGIAYHLRATNSTGSNLYLNLEKTATNTDNEMVLALSTTPGDIYFVADTNGKWQLKAEPDATERVYMVGGAVGKWFKYGTATTGFATSWDLAAIDGVDNHVKFLANNTMYGVGSVGNYTDGAPLWGNQTDPNIITWEITREVAKSYNVTLKYPALAGQSFTETVEIPEGDPISAYVQNFNGFFAYTGSTTATATADANFDVVGTWNMPFAFNTVYRITVNSASNKELCHVSETALAYNSDVEIHHKFWYFTFDSFKDGFVTAKMHSIYGDINQGLIVSPNNDTACTYGENATQLDIVANGSAAENRFAIRVTGTAQAHLNDFGGAVKTWSSGGGVDGGSGSQLHAIALTDSDLPETTLLNDKVVEFKADKLSAARASHSATDVRALFTVGNYTEKSEALAGLILTISEIEKHTIGTGLGQINNSTCDLQTKLNQAKAVLNNPESDDEAYIAATETIAAGTWDLNMPKEGQYFRLKSGNVYMGGYGRPDDGYLRGVAATDGNVADYSGNFGYSVYQLKENKLVAFNSGKVIAGNTAANFSPVLAYATDENACTVTITSNASKTAYNVCLGGGKYLSVTKPASANANLNDVSFETVDWLPIPMASSTAATTIYTTEELQTGGRVNAYILRWDGQFITKTLVTNGIIPAESVALIEGTGTNYDKGCIWLTVNHTATVASEKDMISAQVFAAVHEGAFVYNATTGKFEKAQDNEYIPGFKAYYVPEDVIEHDIAATWPKHNKDIKAEYEGASMKLSHEEGTLSRHEHCTDQIYYVAVSETPKEQAPAIRRVPANATAVEHNDVTYADGAATIQLGSIDNGKYTVTIPAGYFEVTAADGTKNISKEITADVTVKDGTVSGLEELSTINSQLSTIFDLQGRRVAAPVKGINIINGKKVLVK